MKDSRIFWPIILFPFSIDKAHTISYTGRVRIKDIKASFSFARLVLSDKSLICRYRLFNFLIIDLPLQDITEVKSYEEKPGLLFIKFRKATYGKLSKFALSGQPSGSKEKIIINVRNDKDWLDKLLKLSTEQTDQADGNTSVQF